jgi:hypothetical protein
MNPRLLSSCRLIFRRIGIESPQAISPARMAQTNAEMMVCRDEAIDDWSTSGSQPRQAETKPATSRTHPRSR